MFNFSNKQALNRAEAEKQLGIEFTTAIFKSPKDVMADLSEFTAYMNDVCSDFWTLEHNGDFIVGVLNDKDLCAVKMRYDVMVKQQTAYIPYPPPPRNKAYNELKYKFRKLVNAIEKSSLKDNEEVISKLHKLDDKCSFDALKKLLKENYKTAYDALPEKHTKVSTKNILTLYKNNAYGYSWDIDGCVSVKLNNINTPIGDLYIIMGNREHI